MRKNIGKNKTLIMLISIVICALFIGTAISPVMAEYSEREEAELIKIEAVVQPIPQKLESNEPAKEVNNGDGAVDGAVDRPTIESEESPISTDDPDDDPCGGRRCSLYCPYGVDWEKDPCGCTCLEPKLQLSDDDIFGEVEKECALCALSGSAMENELTANLDYETILQEIKSSYTDNELELIVSSLKDLGTEIKLSQSEIIQILKDDIAEYLNTVDFDKLDLSVFQNYLSVLKNIRSASVNVGESEQMDIIPMMSGGIILLGGGDPTGCEDCEGIIAAAVGFAISYANDNFKPAGIPFADFSSWVAWFKVGLLLGFGKCLAELNLPIGSAIANGLAEAQKYPIWNRKSRRRAFISGLVQCLIDECPDPEDSDTTTSSTSAAATTTQTNVATSTTTNVMTTTNTMANMEAPMTQGTMTGSQSL